ncbi:MAG: type II toxin-antitoxin system VapC family toxin [Candidatus Omnitrophota bacterium]|nr:type II toxin-antitoxin system VapC family toxin [Candidatus Omnitrophota bacterium]
MLVDSSGWIEFFTEGPLVDAYASHLKHPHQLITPTVVFYEVYKIIKRQRSEEEALAAIAQMGKTHIVPLTDSLALTAADLSLTYHLAMADAIVYATALTERVTLVTSDADLQHLPGVQYLTKS